MNNEPEFILEAEVESLKLKLESTIKMKYEKGRRYFISKVKFYKNETEVSDFEELYGNEFEGLMKKYQEVVESPDENHYDRFFAKKDSKSGKLGFWVRIRNIPLGLEIATSSLNVIMVNDNEKMARTTIELDSDIITLFKPSLSTKKMGMYAKIQGINVYFVNTVLREQISRFLDVLKDTISISKKIFVISGTVISAGNFFLTHHHVTNPETIYMTGISELIIIQPFLVSLGVGLATKYWKKLFLFYIRKKMK